MAAGWPTKVTYANGDVFNASDINDTNGTLNYINPTSATDNQVLTRDNVAPGKVKWANSPANTLTTKGDLYYASAANTPARLAIGATDQVLAVSASGIPAWTTGGGGMTLLGSTALSGLTTYTFSSISQSYKMLYLELVNATYNTNDTIYMQLNALNQTNLVYQTLVSGTAVTSANAPMWTLAIAGTQTTQKIYSQTTIYNYADTNKLIKPIVSYNTTFPNTGAAAITTNQQRFGGWQGTTSAGYDGIVNVTSLVIYTTAGSFTAGNAYLYGVK